MANIGNFGEIIVSQSKLTLRFMNNSNNSSKQTSKSGGMSRNSVYILIIVVAAVLVFGIFLFFGLSQGSNDGGNSTDGVEQTSSDGDAARLAEEKAAQEAAMMAEAENNRLLITTFCKNSSVDFYDKMERVMDIKSVSDINSALLSLGFNVAGTKTIYEQGDCGDEEYYPVEVTTYERDKYGYYVNVVITGGYTINITFGSTAAKDAFLQSAINQGYMPSENGVYKGPGDCYWQGSDLDVEGNRIIITERMEC